MRNLLFACLFLALFGCQSKEKSTHVVSETEPTRYLFVLNANEGTFDKKELTLVGVPSVIYFSSRPKRVAGHVSLQQFAEIWDKDKGPRQGNLSVLQVGAGEDVVLNLKEMKVKGGNISFELEAVSGDIPKAFKQAGLFIDIEMKSGDLFARSDFHPLDCSCANVAGND